MPAAPRCADPERYTDGSHRLVMHLHVCYSLQLVDPLTWNISTFGTDMSQQCKQSTAVLHAFIFWWLDGGKEIVPASINLFVAHVKVIKRILFTWKPSWTNRRPLNATFTAGYSPLQKHIVVKRCSLSAAKREGAPGTCSERVNVVPPVTRAHLEDLASQLHCLYLQKGRIFTLLPWASSDWSVCFPSLTNLFYMD